MPSTIPTISPSGDYLAGEVKHLVKAGEHCEGIHDRLISTGPGEAAGRAAIEKAAPGHVQDVRRNFIDLLSPAELDMLAALNERVLRHLGKDDDSPAEDRPS